MVQESDAQILVAGFTPDIFFYRKAGASSHLFYSNAGDLAQFPNSGGGFSDLIGHAGHVLFHVTPQKYKKLVSKN